MALTDVLRDAIVVAPMTKGSNLPFRRLCVESGARVLVSEMVVARRLKQRRRSEFALIRRAPDEPTFAVQLAGTNPEEMAWAAALAEARGADFVDVNLGCPIDHFTRKGLGAALARQPKRVARIVEAMSQRVKVPVTVKMRLGWNDKDRNALEVATAAAEAGAQAVFVHGRTREARYRPRPTGTPSARSRRPCRCPSSATATSSGATKSRRCSNAQAARASWWARARSSTRSSSAKPPRAPRPVTAEDRLAVYRRYVALATEHWGDDEHGRTRVRDFLVWHLGFWCRYVPRREDGSWPTLQQRESMDWAHEPMDALLARADEAAHGWLADRLISGEPVDPADAPPPSHQRAEDMDIVSG